MKKNKYVFISYSRKDSEFVEKLSKDLQKEGILVWRDVEKIQPGENWVESIQKALEGAAVYIYIISKNSIDSQWVSFEQQAALSKNKLLIPIVIDDIDNNQIPIQISMLNWLDLRTNYEEGVSKLLNTLIDITNKENVKKNIKTQTKGYVFISYSTNNIEFVEKLANWLKTQEYAYFDYHSSKRNYHTLFFLELEDQIKNSAAILSILSPEWKKSKWAIREFLFSEEISKPIFLLQHKKMSPCLLTVGIPYIDFSVNEESGFQELKREMAEKKL